MQTAGLETLRRRRLVQTVTSLHIPKDSQASQLIHSAVFRLSDQLVLRITVAKVQLIGSLAYPADVETRAKHHDK